jgi:hypothetical protein
MVTKTGLFVTPTKPLSRRERAKTPEPRVSHKIAAALSRASVASAKSTASLVGRVEVKTAPSIAQLLDAPPQLTRSAQNFVSPKLVSSEALSLEIRGKSYKQALVYDCPEVDDSAIFELGNLRELKVVYLGRLPKVTSLGIERMCASSNRWAKLKEMHFYHLPVSDQTLVFLSKMKGLETVTLTGSECFTFTGLQEMVKAPNLKTLFVLKCPAIDLFAVDELRKIRPDLNICYDGDLEKSAVELAILEADHLRDEKLKDFQHRFWGSEKLDRGAMEVIYTRKLRALKLQRREDWEPKYCELILQSYVNLSRAAWAIRNELFKIGFFTNQDRYHPRSVKEILTLLKTKRYEPESMKLLLDEESDEKTIEQARRMEKELYADKIKELHFAGLGMTRLPRFISEIFPHIAAAKIHLL